MKIDLSKFRETFFEEATERVAELEDGLVRLEKAPDDAELLNGIFRAAHSIKGSSGTFGLTEVTTLTHALEGLLDRMRDGHLAVTRDRIGALLRATDVLGALIVASRAGSPPPAELPAVLDELAALDATPEAPASVTDEPHAARRAASDRRSALDSSSLRVSTQKLDQLIDLVGELVIAQSMVHQVMTNFTPDALPRLQEAVDVMERNTRELQERVMSVRMVEVGAIFRRFPRLVRDLAESLEKEIALEVAGEETELDKGVIEAIADPLTHLVRNAIDHGIEPAAERQLVGKPAHGTIRLAARHEGGAVVVEVTDDGRGLDTRRILEKARECGLVRPEQSLTDDEIHALIFEPGFSTAAVVSDLSGRGVGMDVVKRSVEALNGTVHIVTQPGRGTRFRLKLPLTLAILDGLALRVGDQTYILPLIAIVESLRPNAQALKRIVGRGELVMVRGEALPLVRLHALFGVAGAEVDPRRALVVIVEHDGRRLGLLVDELLGQSQVVIKNLEAGYRRVEGVMGATILGNGSVALILDVQGIARAAAARAADVALETAESLT